MAMEKRDVYEILADWFPDGDYTEEDLWEAIQEANPDKAIYSDGDLTEWL